MIIFCYNIFTPASRSHRRVTDTKRLDERRVMRGSREVSERVRREEHEVRGILCSQMESI